MESNLDKDIKKVSLEENNDNKQTIKISVVLKIIKK